MSTSTQRFLSISQPTPTLLHLVGNAARDCREKTISAKDKPLTKLDFTSSCEDVQKEFIRSYQDKVAQSLVNPLVVLIAKNFQIDRTRFFHRNNLRSEQNRIMVDSRGVCPYRRIFSNTSPYLSCGDPFSERWKSYNRIL